MTSPRIELLEAMENAKEMSRTVARNVINLYAPRSERAWPIANALSVDMFTREGQEPCDAHQDRFTINHKRSTATQIKDARERSEWRRMISANLNALDEETFTGIVNALADGIGAQKSDQWRQAATEHALSMLNEIDASATPAAISIA
jgi:hypothetical protein